MSRNRLRGQTLSATTSQRLLLAVAAACTIGVSALLVTTPPATEFEFMYRAYPAPVWALFAVGLMATVAVFLLDLVEPSDYWKAALAFAVALIVLFNLLPLFRGWALYGRDAADVLAHVGYGREIIRTGHVPAGNFYPAIHVLFAEMRLLGVPTRVASPLFSALFTSLYVVGLFLFTRSFVSDRAVAVVTAGCAVPLVYGKFQHTFHPSFFSFLLLPLFLYLYVRYRRTRRHRTLGFLLVLASVLVVFHPVSSLYVLVILGVSIAVRTASGLLPIDAEGRTGIRPDVAVFGWTAVVWTVWYSRFPFIRDGLRIALGLADASQESVATSYGSEQIAGAQSLRQIVVGFVNQYGPIFLLSVLASLAVLVVARRLRRRNSSFEGVWLSTQFGVGVGIALVAVFTYVVAYNPIRNARYMILVATILSGLFLTWLARAEVVGTGRVDRRVLLAVAVLLVLAVPVSLVNTYQPWYHMTYAEQDGTEWFYEHSNPEIAAVSEDVSSKMAMYVRGTGGDDPTFVDFGPESPVPRNFGYQNNSTLGEAVPPDRRPVYVVTKAYDTEFYTVLKEYLWDDRIVYTEESARTLERDPTVDQVYSNGDYSVWFVNGSAPANTSFDSNATSPAT